MDAVKKNIEALRGRIDTSSQLGKGSTFTLRMPLTMAITEAMLVRVAKRADLARGNLIVHLPVGNRAH